VGKRWRSGGVATTNLGVRARKSAKKIYGGVLKEVGPAIATVLATTPARCSRSGRSPPPRIHSPNFSIEKWRLNTNLIFLGSVGIFEI